MAEWTGLEPATPGVTGRYSNQLNYHSAVVFFVSIKSYVIFALLSIVSSLSARKRIKARR